MRFPHKCFLVLPFLLFGILVLPVASQTAEQLQFYANRIKYGGIEVKRNALAELRNFESEAASRVALPALSDDSEVVRATAARSVIYLPVHESTRALIPLLEEKSAFLRREAAFALGETKGQQAVDPLISHLKSDKKSIVKAACAFALGKVGSIRAVPHLTAILSRKPKRKAQFLRRTVARALGQIAQTIQHRGLAKTTPESFLPEKYKTIAKPRNQGLTSSFPEFANANAALITSMQNRKETDDVKREVAFALGEIGDKSSIPVLRLNLNNSDYYLAEISKEALLKIKE